MAILKKVKKNLLLARNNLFKQLKPLRKNRHKSALFGGIIFSSLLICVSIIPYLLTNSEGKEVLGANISRVQNTARTALASPIVEITVMPTKEPTVTPTAPPTPIPTLIPTNTPVLPTFTPTPNAINPDQYTAEKLNDNTWRVKDVSNDDRMATADEIVNALNSYRGANGRGSLSVDPFLSNYATERANLFSGNGGLDSHAGFRSFMDNGGFDKAGFNSLGENSAFVSGPMNGEKIIKQIFGADPSHDSNQLDSWTHVGVGVNGNAVNVNFGRGKR